MKPYRADRVVRVLTAIVSFAYFASLAGGVLALIAIPVRKALHAESQRGAGGGNYTFGWDVLVKVRDAGTTAQTAWGPMELHVGDASAELRVPIDAIPWDALAIVWVAFATVVGLAVLSLYHLRRIFQRVRDGAPFDARNAVRMRTLGLLLLAGEVYYRVMEVAVSRVLLRSVDAGAVTVSRWIDFDVMSIFVALAVVALAEVFRRGAELEDEQALVV